MPAIGEHGLAGHESRLVGREEHDGPSQVVGGHRPRPSGIDAIVASTTSSRCNTRASIAIEISVHDAVLTRMLTGADFDGEVPRQQLSTAFDGADDDVVRRHEVGADR